MLRLDPGNDGTVVGCGAPAVRWYLLLSRSVPFGLCQRCIDDGQALRQNPSREIQLSDARRLDAVACVQES